MSFPLVLAARITKYHGFVLSVFVVSNIVQFNMLVLPHLIPKYLLLISLWDEALKTAHHFLCENITFITCHWYMQNQKYNFFLTTKCNCYYQYNFKSIMQVKKIKHTYTWRCRQTMQYVLHIQVKLAYLLFNLYRVQHDAQ